MFKILDRYIIRKFLGTYIFAIILLLAIVIVFDINEKLDAFLKAPLKATVMDYFVNFLPYFANQFSPLFTFIAVIFFTSKLAGNSEFIAMFSTGMSFRRLLRPYLISAAIIAAATFVLSAYIIPPANVKRIEYTNRYVRNKSVDYGANVMLMVAPGQIAYMASYENNALQAGLRRRPCDGIRCTTGTSSTLCAATSPETARLLHVVATAIPPLLSNPVIF